VSNIQGVTTELPELLQQRAEQQWQQLCEKLGDENPLTDDTLKTETQRVLVLSDFVSQSLQRDTTLLSDLLASTDITTSYSESHYSEYLTKRLDGCSDEKQLSELLRKFRRREMVRIAWRDLTGRADLIETTADLSHLADACADGLESIVNVDEPYMVGNCHDGQQGEYLDTFFIS